MQVQYAQAKRIILNAYPDSVVTSGMKLPNGYLFSIQPKTWKEDEILLDPFFKVDGNTGKVTEYSPVMNPEEFKQALNNVIE
jgi:hypothetical protein